MKTEAEYLEEISQKLDMLNKTVALIENQMVGASLTSHDKMTAGMRRLSDLLLYFFRIVVLWLIVSALLFALMLWRVR